MALSGGNVKRALLIIFVLAMGLLVPVSTAGAQSGDDETYAGGTPRTQPVKGGEATCTVEPELDGIRCDIKDTAADKASIYVKYEGMDRSGRFDNKEGSGSSVTKEKYGLPRGVDSSTFRWKVCRDETLGTDDCSDWVKYASGPNGSPIEVYCERPASDDENGSNAYATPVCYLPNRGLDQDRVSSACLREIAEQSATMFVGGTGVKVVTGTIKKVATQGPGKVARNGVSARGHAVDGVGRTRQHR